MPKHLFPGYRQNRAASATNENNGDDNENEEDEGNSFNLLRYSIIK